MSRRQSFQMARETSPLLGDADIRFDDRTPSNPWRNSLITICFMWVEDCAANCPNSWFSLTVVAATFLVLDPNGQSGSRKQSGSLFKGSLLTSNGAEQPEQPQQKDWKKWLQAKLDDDYKKVHLKSSESDNSNGHQSKDHKEQNASLIIESVGKLLDSVGRNFLPKTMNLKDLKQLLDDMKSNGSQPSPAPVLKSPKPKLMLIEESTLVKLQNQLDELRLKFFTAIQQTSDKKVEIDIRNIIDNMRDQVSSLWLPVILDHPDA